MTDITAYEGWALVEQMGFRKTVGKIAEVEQYGAKMLRLDIPAFDATGEADVVAVSWSTRFCGGPSIYQVTPLDEAVALAMAKRQGDPRPVKPIEYRIEDQRKLHEEQVHHSDADDDDLVF